MYVYVTEMQVQPHTACRGQLTRVGCGIKTMSLFQSQLMGREAQASQGYHFAFGA